MDGRAAQTADDVDAALRPPGGSCRGPRSVTHTVTLNRRLAIYGIRPQFKNNLLRNFGVVENVFVSCDDVRSGRRVNRTGHSG